MLEDVEVIFGPSPVLYGSDALGGTINMKTKDVYFKTPKNGVVVGHLLTAVHTVG